MIFVFIIITLKIFFAHIVSILWSHINQVYGFVTSRGSWLACSLNTVTSGMTNVSPAKKEIKDTIPPLNKSEYFYKLTTIRHLHLQIALSGFLYLNWMVNLLYSDQTIMSHSVYKISTHFLAKVLLLAPYRIESNPLERIDAWTHNHDYFYEYCCKYWSFLSTKCEANKQNRARSKWEKTLHTYM